MNLILSGFKGSGKSHYGKLLAERRKCTFVDTDRLLEERFVSAGDNCREIASCVGEKTFRLYEHEVIATLSEVKNAVIAIGGGALLYPPSAKLLSKLGKIIYLKLDKQVLEEQCALPVFFDSADFERMYQQREPVYANWAHYTLTLKGKTEHDVLKELHEYIRNDF